MAKSSVLLFLISFLASEALAANAVPAVAAIPAGAPRTYIVQMKAGSSANRLARRQASLQAAAVDPNALLYHYDTVVDGYAAHMTQEQASTLLAHPDVLSVQPDGIKYLHTTHTPQFLGIDDASLAQNPLFSSGNITADESNVVVGVLDTGVWPDSASYDDTGFSAPPATWKGICQTGDSFTAANCNNKLIGARVLYKGLEAYYASFNTTFNWTAEYKSPRDAGGHGTHTSSTVLGSPVPGVSLYGNALGTARGVVPGARLAVYKVCFEGSSCFDSDILAAMDTAVKDGVNILSMSLGGVPALGYSDSTGNVDVISTGSYSAVAHGVLVSCSAGNSGPDPGTVANNAPWIMTVGASSLDRDFPAGVTLGNGKRFGGQSLYTNTSVPDISPVAIQSYTPMVLSSTVALPSANVSDAELCIADTLDPKLVKGKIVVCLRGVNGRVEKGLTVRAAGGAGMVLINDAANGDGLVADAHVVPGLILPYSALAPVQDYIKSAGANATGIIDLSGTVLGVPAPNMASFSSRGPNVPAPFILKPDITGPGVNILAAWSERSPTGFDADTRKVSYNFVSGTSMSCPHLSGMAAFVMARKPSWSVAAVKSALMTTAYQTLKGTQTPIGDEAGGTAAAFDYGNGHGDAVAALDPGLIYDIQPKEYLDFLCGFNYTDAQIQTISRDNFACDTSKKYSVYDLNLPSFSVWYNTNTTKGDYTVTYNRNVTNVGGASTYKVAVSGADSSLVKIQVKPDTLTFSAAGESQSYAVTVTAADPNLGSDPYAYKLSSARLVWSDGTHTVGSNMGIYWGAPTDVGFYNQTASVPSLGAI